LCLDECSKIAHRYVHGFTLLPDLDNSFHVIAVEPVQLGRGKVVDDRVDGAS
jgi:hypothetical protein